MTLCTFVVNIACNKLISTNLLSNFCSFAASALALFYFKVLCTNCVEL